jgi:hypothetical protein
MPKKPVHRFGLPESSRRGHNVEKAAFVNAVGFLSSADPLQHFCRHGYSAFWVIHTKHYTQLHVKVVMMPWRTRLQLAGCGMRLRAV